MNFPQYRRLIGTQAIFKFISESSCEVTGADRNYTVGLKFYSQDIHNPGWEEVGPINTYITI